MDEDPLQHQICLLIFVESLEMIFSQYTETCEVIIDYPKIGGDDIEDYAKKAIRNLLRENVDVHRKRLIAEFPIYGIKCIKNCNHIVQIWILMIVLFNRSHINEGNLQ